MPKNISLLNYILLLFFLGFSCSKGDGINQAESELVADNGEDSGPG